MLTFEEIKKELLRRAKKANACKTGYEMGLNAKNKIDLLNAITTNWSWVLRTSQIVNVSFLEENFTEEELKEAGIYTRKKHRIDSVAYVCGSATVEAYGSAKVKVFDSAKVEAYDSATVKAYHHAYVEDYTGKIKSPKDWAIIRDCCSFKIYVKKDNFKIVEK